MEDDGGQSAMRDAVDEEALLDDATALLGFDTQNPPGRTVDAIDWLERRFDDAGLATESHVAEPDRPNLLARLPAGDAAEAADAEEAPTLCLLGHVDTVPVEPERWRRDPFGERDGDRLYGRGATDMKGALAAMIAAAEHHADRGDPPAELLFAVVGDEETAGAAGLPALLEDDRLDADDCVIGEPTCERGRHSVTVADRGSIWLTLTATGEAAHGSRPALGVNAIDRCYAAVEAVRDAIGGRDLAVPDAMDPIVEESVAYYAPTMGEASARELFAHPTINLGVLEGGDAVNTVPDRARAELDVRLAAGVPTREVLDAIRTVVDDHEGVAIDDVAWSVGTYEPIDGPLVDAVASTAADVTGERVYRRSATGGGDVKSLRDAEVSTVEFALGTDTAHAVDEYTTVDALVGNAAVYAALPHAYAVALDRA